MAELPLAVVIAALVKEDKILLIQRKKGDYTGLWGLPGGKIEKAEHLSAAAVREVFEESGIPAVFKEHLGFVSEHLVSEGKVMQHFLLHVCALEPQTMAIVAGNEGQLRWFPLAELKENQQQIIPSDYLIIENLVTKKGKPYFECVLEKKGEEYFLRKFA